MKRVLITGATGFVGRRLVFSLINENINLRLLVRNKNKLEYSIIERTEIYEGDTFNLGVLENSLKEVDVAVYLIHMMGKSKDYEEKERISAKNFIESCEKAGVKQIIYLGGLGELKDASPHLRSRYITGEILSSKPDKVKAAWFRAGVIIGSGSASFEILRNLVEKLPIMITPRWVNTPTCPIFIDDVIKYLKSAILSNTTIHGKIDIGMQPMTFKEMMLETAEVLGLKRVIINVPVLTPKLSSYWLILFTPVNFELARELVLGLKSKTVKNNDNAEKYFPNIRVTPFKKAIRQALEEIEKNQVISRWCDSSKGFICDVPQIPEISKAVYVDRYAKKIEPKVAKNIFEICKNLGGQRGWYALNFLWGIRGLIDKLLGGYGLNRGRRTSHGLRIGDVIDFWKVIDIAEGQRLLLEAQMKLPGKAWLEFLIAESLFTQTAYFYPKGLGGRIYWHMMLPFHKIIFKMMLNKIVEEASKDNY
ncbi:MAG: SDR family oxidoreductase [Thermodesulfovibrio sp.]|nr:SDR family oxidoreductase [Thermodesulfovibrio sp.]